MRSSRELTLLANRVVASVVSEHPPSSAAYSTSVISARFGSMTLSLMKRFPRIILYRSMQCYSRIYFAGEVLAHCDCDFSSTKQLLLKIEFPFGLFLGEDCAHPSRFPRARCGCLCCSAYLVPECSSRWCCVRPFSDLHGRTHSLRVTRHISVFCSHRVHDNVSRRSARAERDQRLYSRASMHTRLRPQPWRLARGH
jgi:hypothetical protein